MTLDPELQRLIESARDADLPDAARVSRVREQLLQKVGPIGSGAASATHAAAGAKAAAGGVGLAIKAAGLLSLVGLAVWTVQHLPQRPEVAKPVAGERSGPAADVAEPATPEAPLPATASAGASAPLQPAAAGTTPAVEHPTPRPRARAPAHERVAPHEPANDFAEELSLMQRAVQARRAGRVAEARALVAEHARRYPRGALRVERERLAAQLTAETTGN